MSFRRGCFFVLLFVLAFSGYAEVSSLRPAASVRAELQNLLSQYGLSVEVAGDKVVVVRGEIKDPKAMKEVRKILDVYPEGQVLDLVRYRAVPPKFLVECEVYVADNDKAKDLDLELWNLRWGITPSGWLRGEHESRYEYDNLRIGYGVETSIRMDLFYKWASKGVVRMISAPSLIVGEGERGRLIIGGAIPYAYRDEERWAMEWKEYGTELTIVPEEWEDGNIKVDIKVSLSSPSFFTTDAGPSLIKRGLSTTLVVKEGMDIVLAGLRYRTRSYTRGWGCLVLLPVPFINGGEEEKVMYICLRINRAQDGLKKEKYYKGDE